MATLYVCYIIGKISLVGIKVVCHRLKHLLNIGEVDMHEHSFTISGSFVYLHWWGMALVQLQRKKGGGKTALGRKCERSRY